MEKIELNTNKNGLAINIVKGILLVVPFLIGMYGPVNMTGIHLQDMPGDLGDSRLINYILEHGYQFISGNRSSFYDAPYFYPAKNVISLSDDMLGSLPIYSFFRIQGFNRETAYQLWWLSVFALNYFISFWCFRKFTGNFYASVIVAWLFTFSVLNFVHYNFIQVNSKYLLPIIFLYFFDWLRTSSTRSFNIMLAVFFLQILTSVYYCIFSIFFFTVISVVHFFVTRSFKPYTDLFISPIKNKKAWLSLLVTVVLCLLVMYPHLSTVGDVVKFRPYDSIIDLVPKPQSFISASIVSHWSDLIGNGGNYFPANWWYHAFFPGIFICLILFITPIFLILKAREITKLQVVILISFVILFFFCIRWDDKFSPLRYLYELHLFGPIFFVSRVILPLELLFLFFTAFLLSSVLGKRSLIACMCFLVYIVCLISWDHLPKEKLMNGLPKAQLYKRYDKIMQEVKKQNLQSAKSLAIIASATGDQAFRQDAMMISQTLNLNCINGYSSNAPNPSAVEFWGNPTRQTLENYCKTNNIDISTVLIIENPN